MAKSNSIFNLQGTIAGLTFVNSKRYKPHVRTARGSKTKVEVNDTFRRNNSAMISGNVAAKLIKDALDPHRQDFKGGDFWQKAVGIFQKQFKTGQDFHVEDLKGLEINDRYPLGRLLPGFLDYTLSIDESKLHFGLDLKAHPDFKRKFVTGYRAALIFVFPDFVKGHAASAVGYSPVIYFNSPCTPIHFSIDKPKKFDQYLVVLKIEACEKDVVLRGNALKGMKIIAAAEFG